MRRAGAYPGRRATGRLRIAAVGLAVLLAAPAVAEDPTPSVEHLFAEMRRRATNCEMDCDLWSSGASIDDPQAGEIFWESGFFAHNIGLGWCHTG